MNTVRTATFSLFTAALFLGSAAATVKFQEVMDVILEKREELSKHRFFEFLADENIPASKRIQFVPYWTYFALAAPDVLDNWMRVPNPRTELEYRVNAFIDEDSFHYNLFLHDIESVLSYTPERFGSFGGILRHIWGDDSRAVRMLIYSWASGVKKNKDPIVTLASFEAVEAGLKDFVETVYGKLFLAKDGYSGLKYFGQAHVDFEMNHTVTGWFKDGTASEIQPLEEFDISEEVKATAMEVVEDMFYW